MQKLNLGSGNLPLDGYKNIDISRTAKADEFYDVTLGIKEADNSCDEVHAGCMLEQIESNKDFIFVMNEVWRVLIGGGVFRGYVPTPDPRVMYLDPVDRRFFLPETFRYFVRHENAWMEFGRNYGFMGWSDVHVSVNDNGILHFVLTK